MTIIPMTLESNCPYCGGGPTVPWDEIDAQLCRACGRTWQAGGSPPTEAQKIAALEAQRLAKLRVTV